MAIITFAAPISGARGKIGGLIYSANKSGPFVKTWAKPSNPRSHKQSLKRGEFGSLSQAWRDLTSLQRTDWDTWAALAPQQLTNSLGETYYASGFNWYVKINTQRFDVGLTTLRNAIPTQGRAGAPTITTFVMTEADPAWTAIFTFPAGIFTGNYVLVKAVTFPSKGQLTAYHGFRTVYSELDPIGTTIDVEQEIRDIFGNYYDDQRGSIKVYEQRPQGVRSAPTQITATIT